MVIFRLIWTVIKKIFRLIIDNLIRILPIYYTNCNKISLYSWFKVLEKDLSFLYKVRIFKRIPYFFYNIAYNMLFQFDIIDLSLIKKKADLVVLKSKALRTGDKSMEFVAAQNEKAFNESNKTVKGLTLNEFIDYIEITFESIGRIDPYKISASRGFSLFKRAKEHNKRLQEIHEKQIAYGNH